MAEAPSLALDKDGLPTIKYPARLHLARAVAYLRDHIKSPLLQDLDDAVLVVAGSRTSRWPNCDQDQPLRPDRHFYWLTGATLADATLVHVVRTQKSVLFIPPVVADEVVWSGLPLQADEALKKYDVDEVRTTDTLEAFLADPALPRALALSVDDAHVSLAGFGASDAALLKQAVDEARVVKDAHELALMRRANRVTAVGHVAVAQALKAASNERQLYALFLQRCTALGNAHQAYSPIFGSGTSAATLHYVHNAAPLDAATTLNLLVDAGAEQDLYAADVTRTLPVGGAFTAESRAIYALVLAMQKACIARIRAGMLWDELQLLAHEMVVDGLLELGILRGDRAAILKAETGAAFFPHGLGHYLGLDTHDTGGHPNYSDPSSYFRYLRVRGRVPAGSVVTVEPGVYFCRFIIEPYLKDGKHGGFIDAGVLERYWAVGGVRIEDDIVVLADGYENLTTAPKEIAEIEALVQGGGIEAAALGG